MIKKVLVGVATAAAVTAIPAAAFADSCANVSRAPAPCGMSCPTPVVVGNWVWLPSLDSLLQDNLPPLWGFLPPGAQDSVMIGAPGSNGNYTNGQTSSLLGMSANCPPGSNTARQSSHGIQSGCE